MGSKLLPGGSMVAPPVVTAIHRYQTEAPPALPACSGSPGSLVAMTFEPGIVATTPEIAAALAKRSLLGTTTNDLVYWLFVLSLSATSFWESTTSVRLWAPAASFGSAKSLTDVMPPPAANGGVTVQVLTTLPSSRSCTWKATFVALAPRLIAAQATYGTSSVVSGAASVWLPATAETTMASVHPAGRVGARSVCGTAWNRFRVTLPAAPALPSTAN